MSDWIEKEDGPGKISTKQYSQTKPSTPTELELQQAEKISVLEAELTLMKARLLEANDHIRTFEAKVVAEESGADEALGLCVN